MKRRDFLGALVGALAAGTAVRAKTPALFTYKGVNVDEAAVPADRRADLEIGLRQQIDLVQSVKIKPEIAAFFQSVPIRIDPSLHEPGHYDESGLRLWDRSSPAENPVLLHELLHGWLSRSSPDERATIRAAYEAARSSGRYPADAYMISNEAEFFAMTASVVLWGRAARLPFERARVRADMPEYYDWLVRTFGLQT